MFGLVVLLTSVYTNRVFTKKEAGHLLLRELACYDDGQSSGLSVASFQRGAVSLPADVRDSPLAEILLPSESRGILEEFESTILRSAEEMREVESSVNPLSYTWTRSLKATPTCTTSLFVI